jgi:hypothetical protein
MKFGYAHSFADKPRGETPAPPFKKRTPVLPRLPACRALSRQIGKCIFRTGRGHQLAFGGYVLSPGVPHLAALQKRHNRRLSYPPPSHKACLENIHCAAPVARCALPCLRAPDWAVSPHRACFCLLGASDIGSDITDGGIRPKGRMRDCRKGPQNTEAFYRRSQECLLRFKRTRHYAARQFVKKRYISCRRLSWLMMVWLTHAPPSILSALSRVFCHYSFEFYYSKALLNII